MPHLLKRLTSVAALAAVLSAAALAGVQAQTAAAPAEATSSAAAAAPADLPQPEGTVDMLSLIHI